MQVNLVFEGGGVKGIAHVGALHAIETNALLQNAHIEVMGVGGSSAGAIIAALYAAGYSAQEMKDALALQPLADLLGRTPWKAESLVRFLLRKGIYSTNGIESWLNSLLLAKGVDGDRGITKAQQSKFRRQVPCRIVSTDLTNGRPKVYRSEEDGGKGLAKAVLQSLSIPLFFQPYSDGGDLFVDGGVVSNYPTWLFHESDFPTIGVRLRSTSPQGAKSDSGTVDYLRSLLNTMLSGNDERERMAPRLREILIPANTVSSIKFKLSKAEEGDLFAAGHTAALNFDWTNLPSTRGCVFNDPNAAVVLENTANTLKEIVRSTNRTGKRRYELYEETWTCLRSGGAKIETHFRLKNEGTDPTSVIRTELVYDEPVGISFDDLKFDVRVDAPGTCSAMILPLENKNQLKHYGLWFIPPILGGETREVWVKLIAPRLFGQLLQKKMSEVAWVLEHENGIDLALLEVRVPKELGALVVEAPPGTTAGKAETALAGSDDEFHRARWRLEGLKGTLDFAAKLVLR
ncbi:MAG TPA: patatin-like phospholipase family protein [Candidatus Binataceae bacterium]|nr:patatin-like phospholipase family protein [Candidatus Binataceae bacterium]